MPFKTKQIALSEIDSLWPEQAVFNDQNLFGRQIVINASAKKAVAFCVAGDPQICSSGANIFVSDGSSTFYVCLAMALYSYAFATPLNLVTNNFGIAAQLETNPLVPAPKWALTMLGGLFDSGLSATFPSEVLAKETLKDVKRAIISVQHLFLKEGPTSPDDHSSRVKKMAIELAGSVIIIPLDWRKLSVSHPMASTPVFNEHPTVWDHILSTRTITIVSDKPNIPRDMPPDKRGEKLDRDGFHRDSTTCVVTPSWDDASDFDRYCWNVYQFSRRPNVTFIEVEVIVDDQIEEFKQAKKTTQLISP